MAQHNYFYNGPATGTACGSHQGKSEEWYTVIRKDSQDNTADRTYMTQLAVWARPMYSIGFCLRQDNQITVCQHGTCGCVILPPNRSSITRSNTADQLSHAFTAIGNEIAYAATNARFVDTMGANYDLQMKHSTYTLSDGTTTDTIEPEIIVQAYDIYTKADGVAESEIGKRKGTSTVLETVTFNEGGTEAYSDKKTAIFS